MSTELPEDGLDELTLDERRLPPEERLKRAQGFLKRAQARGADGAAKYWQRVIDNTRFGRPLPVRTSAAAGEPDPDGADDRPADDEPPPRKPTAGPAKGEKKLPEADEKLATDAAHRKTIGQKVGGLLGNVAATVVDGAVKAVKGLAGASDAVGKWASGARLDPDAKSILGRAASLALMGVLGAAAFGGVGVLAGMALANYFVKDVTHGSGAERRALASGGGRDDEKPSAKAGKKKPKDKSKGEKDAKGEKAAKGEKGAKGAKPSAGKDAPAAKPAKDGAAAQDDHRAGTGPKPEPDDAALAQLKDKVRKQDAETDADLRKLKRKVRRQDKKKAAAKLAAKVAAKRKAKPAGTKAKHPKLQALATRTRDARATRSKRKAGKRGARKESLAEMLHRLLAEAGPPPGDNDAALRAWVQALIDAAREGFERLGELDDDEVEALLRAAHDHPEVVLGDA